MQYDRLPDETVRNSRRVPGENDLRVEQDHANTCRGQQTACAGLHFGTVNVSSQLHPMPMKGTVRVMDLVMRLAYWPRDVVAS